MVNDEQHPSEEDAVRLAVASLHAAIRKFRQTALPLLGPQTRGLPLKSNTAAAFTGRMMDDVTQGALECLRVIPRDRVLGEMRRRDILQWLSIPSGPPEDATPLPMLFLKDLKARLTLVYADAVTGSPLRTNTTAAGEPTEALAVVPVIIVLRVAELLFAQRETTFAETILWADGVEELLTVGGEYARVPSSTMELPAEAFLRAAVVLSRMHDAATTSTVAQRGPASSETRAQSLLAPVVELWAWCKATNNCSAVADIEAALQDPSTMHLIKCWFPAGEGEEAWSRLSSKIHQRAASLQQQALKKQIRSNPTTDPREGVSASTSPPRQVLREQLLSGSSSTIAARAPSKEVVPPPASPTSASDLSDSRVVQPRAPESIWSRVVTAVTSRISSPTSGPVVALTVAVVVLIAQLLVARYMKRAGTPPARRALSL